MIRKFLIYSVCLSTLALSACDQDNSLQETGTVSLRITDAPTDAENIAGVYITIDGVEYKHEDKWHQYEGFQGPKTLNLLELTEGKTAILGDFIVGAGAYSNMRFHLATSGSEDGADYSNYIAFTDGSKESLFVPSGNQSGYKVLGDFVVPVNGTVFITADFDVRKSVVKSGNSGKWILKPVIRLVVNDQAGTISGNIEGGATAEQYIVYAYANDTYSETEAQIPAEGETQFPNAVSSTMVHEGGVFSLAFLAPGTYDLVIAAYSDGNFLGVIGGIDNVKVTSLETTEVNTKL